MSLLMVDVNDVWFEKIEAFDGSIHGPTIWLNLPDELSLHCLMN